MTGGSILKPLIGHGRIQAAALAVALLLTNVPTASAGGGPENVALVVNAESADSVAVAREYARLRSIHPRNVIELHGVPASAIISVSDFRDKILSPVLAAIRARGLSAQVDYIVYSAGFPFGVDVGADAAGRSFPKYITRTASLTGLTYLYQLVLARNPGYLALNPNWYWRRPQSSPPDTPWTDDDQRKQSFLLELIKRIQAEQQRDKPAQSPGVRRWVDEAVAISESLRLRHPNNAELLYDLACFFALQGKADDAIRMLTSSQRAGWRGAAIAAVDPDLQSLRSRADFQDLLAKMRAAKVVMQPVRSFHHSTGWTRTGEAGQSGPELHYYLSAMLAYTGKAANSLPESLECLRTSARADGTCPRGTIYFMASSDGARTGARQWAFESAASALRRLGVNAEVLNGVLPPQKQDVAGTMVGAASFAWKTSGSRILAGAFCDHLTSFGGVMSGAGQTSLSEFLRYGAAGASGTVTEPYAIQAKFPNAFLHVYYASGCSLAEAFYQSVSGPYQILLVGDPLCRPWARIPVLTVEGIKPDAVVKTRRALTPHARSALPIIRYELYVDGRLRQEMAPGRRLVLDPAGLAPGRHEARIVAVAGPLEITGRLIVPFSTAGKG